MFPFVCEVWGGGGGVARVGDNILTILAEKIIIKDVSVSCSRKPDEEGVR